MMMGVLMMTFQVQLHVQHHSGRWKSGSWMRKPWHSTGGAFGKTHDRAGTFDFDDDVNGDNGDADWENGKNGDKEDGVDVDLS